LPHRDILFERKSVSTQTYNPIRLPVQLIGCPRIIATQQKSANSWWTLQSFFVFCFFGCASHL